MSLATSVILWTLPASEDSTYLIFMILQQNPNWLSQLILCLDTELRVDTDSSLPKYDIATIDNGHCDAGLA